MQYLHFFALQNDVYLIMLSFLVHKIFMFYIKSALKFRCPTLPPKSKGVIISLSLTGLIPGGRFYWASCMMLRDQVYMMCNLLVCKDCWQPTIWNIWLSGFHLSLTLLQYDVTVPRYPLEYEYCHVLFSMRTYLHRCQPECWLAISDLVVSITVFMT
jgi:hypothetical protein